jgi:hypothetical protein
MINLIMIMESNDQPDDQALARRKFFPHLALLSSASRMIIIMRDSGVRFSRALAF